MAIDYTREEPDWWMPKAWPLVWRRAFFITLPVSGTLWVFLVMACGLATMALCLLMAPFWLLFDLKTKLWDWRENENMANR